MGQIKFSCLPVMLSHIVRESRSDAVGLLTSAETELHPKGVEQSQFFLRAAKCAGPASDNIIINIEPGCPPGFQRRILAPRINVLLKTNSDPPINAHDHYNCRCFKTNKK